MKEQEFFNALDQLAPSVESQVDSPQSAAYDIRGQAGKVLKMFPSGSQDDMKESYQPFTLSEAVKYFGLDPQAKRDSEEAVSGGIRDLKAMHESARRAI